MKKCLLVLMMFCAVSLFADNADEVFETFVSGLQESLDEGVTVQKDTRSRTVYINMPTDLASSDITTEVCSLLKTVLLQQLKKDCDEGDIQVVKDAKITMVFNLISTDGQKFPITISWLDL